MFTQRTAISIVKDFIAVCAQRNLRFNKVILFGSAATRKIHKHSDIDVALVSDQFSGKPFSDWSLLTPVKISDRKFMDIEPHTFSTKSFDEGDPFIDEIKKTGIEIQ